MHDTLSVPQDRKVSAVIWARAGTADLQPAAVCDVHPTVSCEAQGDGSVEQAWACGQMAESLEVWNLGHGGGGPCSVA